MAMGLWMAPSGLMMMIMSPVGAKLSAARGPKVTLAVSTRVRNPQPAPQLPQLLWSADTLAAAPAAR